MENTVFFSGDIIKVLLPITSNGYDYIVAENMQVSRQAIYDSLKKSEKKLLEIESKVGALKIIKSLRGE